MKKITKVMFMSSVGMLLIGLLVSCFSMDTNKCRLLLKYTIAGDDISLGNTLPSAEPEGHLCTLGDALLSGEPEGHLCNHENTLPSAEPEGHLCTLGDALPSGEPEGHLCNYENTLPSVEPEGHLA